MPLPKRGARGVPRWAPKGPRVHQQTHHRGGCPHLPKACRGGQWQSQDAHPAHPSPRPGVHPRACVTASAALQAGRSAPWVRQVGSGSRRLKPSGQGRMRVSI